MRPSIPRGSLAFELFGKSKALASVGRADVDSVQFVGHGKDPEQLPALSDFAGAKPDRATVSRYRPSEVFCTKL